MDRFNTDKSKQDIIDRLKEENEGLKRKIERQDAGAKRINKMRRRWRVCGIILMVTGLFFLGILIYEECKDYKSAKEIKKLQEQKENLYSDEDTSSILPEYRKLYETNSDLAGWIVIDGTDINYPVVQSKVYQEFYLDHNFDGEEDDAGSIFIDARNDILLPDDNIIIYGHNMKNGSMFGTLQKVKIHLSIMTFLMQKIKKSLKNMWKILRNLKHMIQVPICHMEINLLHFLHVIV